MRQAFRLGGCRRLHHLQYRFLRLGHRCERFFERVAKHFVDPFDRNNFDAFFDIVRNLGQILDVFMRDERNGDASTQCGEEFFFQSTDGQNFATQAWVAAQGYATQAWVRQQFKRLRPFRYYNSNH